MKIVEGEIIEPDELGGFDKDQISFQQLVLAQLYKILKLASQEFHGGYWETKIKEVGGTVYRENHYVTDKREEFSNSVDILADLIATYYDKKIKDQEEKLNDELKDIKKECTFKNHLEEEELDTIKFKELKVENKRKLFRALSSFIKRKKYFGGTEFMGSSA